MECLFKLFCLCMYIKRLKSILKPIINTSDLKVVCVTLSFYLFVTVLLSDTLPLSIWLKCFSLRLCSFDNTSNAKVLLLIHSNLFGFAPHWGEREQIVVLQAVTMKIENCGGARKRFIELIGFVEKSGCFFISILSRLRISAPHSFGGDNMFRIIAFHNPFPSILIVIFFFS